jgi:hypothetical protein
MIMKLTLTGPIPRGPLGYPESTRIRANIMSDMRMRKFRSGHF